jgi:hypothetical protein
VRADWMESITMGQIFRLHKMIKEDTTIGHWKRVVKKFAVDNNLSDQEALFIARIEGIDKWL